MKAETRHGAGAGIGMIDTHSISLLCTGECKWVWNWCRLEL